ncbi:hypothetical protein [Helicobacter sp.]
MDKYGRKKGLLVTLTLMAIGTLTIAFCVQVMRVLGFWHQLLL